MTRRLPAALLLLAALLIAFAEPAPAPTVKRPLALRALGPFADLYASIEWIRFGVGRREGDWMRAIEHGENALRARPEDTDGWQLIASVLFERTSPERTPDPDERLTWLRAALELTRRGEEVARDPGSLALLRALFLLRHADVDADTRFPGGAEGARRAALTSLERAVRLGDARASELLDALR
ncbi:MAG: hypothetical protein WD226_09810 [Planctomycetota bacterium]